DHARKPPQWAKLFAQIGPFLQVVDGDVVARLAPDAAGEERARHVDVLLVALEGHRRSAGGAEAADAAAVRVLVAGEVVFALHEAKLARPRPHIGGVGSAVSAPRRC